jgi:hypothetical protein
MCLLERDFLLCNSTSGIAPACGQSIGSADDALVKEPCGPDLARHETGAQNSNKEPQSYQAIRACNQPRHGCWYRSSKQYADENQSRTKAVT